MTEVCTCNSSKTKENTCFRCKTIWTAECSKIEKMTSCEEHRGCVAWCGGSPPMCETCTNEGYYVQPSLGFCSIPKIKKH